MRSSEFRTASVCSGQRNCLIIFKMADRYRRRCLLFLLVVLVRRYRIRRTAAKKTVMRDKRSVWVRNIFRARKAKGEYHNLVSELRLGDREMYFRYMRMSPENFTHLLSLVGPKIERKDTVMRAAISASERLALTIHYLAYGDSQQSMSFSYRIAKSTVSSIISETCVALWETLVGTYLRRPKTAEEWMAISDGFRDIWNFPHCLGAVDGKHVSVKCPINSGSQFFNYKGFFSIVLLAVCDANYSFTFVDIGNFGCSNDSSVFTDSDLGKELEGGKMNLPTACALDGFPDFLMPYFFVGDEAFALKSWMQRPYPGKSLNEEKRIYNYRLSRARRTIENAFGIMVARWRILTHPIPTSVDTAQKIVEATVCLHNYLRQTGCASYCPEGFVDSEDATGNVKPGEWRGVVGGSSTLAPLAPCRGSRHPQNAVKAQEVLKDYLNSEYGSVSWQWDYVRSKGPIT